jgi:hypothetical protein
MVRLGAAEAATVRLDEGTFPGGEVAYAAGDRIGTLDRGCVKTRLNFHFRGLLTSTRPQKIEYSAIRVVELSRKLSESRFHTASTLSGPPVFHTADMGE